MHLYECKAVRILSGYNYHKTGLQIKFGHDDDLTSFQDAVMDHLTDTGMDSILYLPDPKDATKMISAITSKSLSFHHFFRENSLGNIGASF
jgi:hypothetical protein